MYRLALASLLVDQHDGACAALDLAHEELADRAEPDVLATVAWAELRAGRIEQARDAALRAVEGTAPVPPVAYRAGVVLVASGDAKAGRALLQEALEGAVELTTDEVIEAERLLEGGTLDVPAPSECAAGRS